jgi:glycosyltransferase involved in cell wall biosynthesis
LSDQPFVSVLMTAYNREQFIAEAIGSVLASTHENYELIIVDDHSADNTVHIARSFAERDKRVRVFVNERNLGDYPNRNRAASYAGGKYLKFVDSDDRIYPETLSTMVDILERHPDAGFGLVYVATSSNWTFPVFLDGSAAYKQHYFRQPIFFASPGQAIFRKDAFDAVGGFPEKRMVGDFEMWHKFSLMYPLVLMPGDLYWIRTHRGQEVSNQRKYVLEYEKIKIKYLFSGRAPLVHYEAIEIVKKRQTTVMKIFFRKLLAGQFGEAGIRLKIYLFYLRNLRRLKSQC